METHDTDTGEVLYTDYSMLGDVVMKNIKHRG